MDNKIIDELIDGAIWEMSQFYVDGNKQGLWATAGIIAALIALKECNTPKQFIFRCGGVIQRIQNAKNSLSLEEGTLQEFRSKLDEEIKDGWHP